MHKFKNKRLAITAIAIAICGATVGGISFLTCNAQNNPEKAETEIVATIPDAIETSANTEPVSEKETTEPTTEKPTEAPTEKPTEKPTEAPTEAPTEKETEPTAKKNVEKKETEENNSSDNVSVDYATQDLLARVIYLESGICSEYCQWLVGSTAMNLADTNGGLAAVAYDYNTFNVAYMIDSCTPSELSMQVAKRILSGDRDYNVKAFRTNYYHNFGTPYTNVDNVYFSTF